MVRHRVTTIWVATPWREPGGNPVLLEMICYRPPGEGPFPSIILNHGSTGGGGDPSRFRITWVATELGELLVARGWQVFFPQRRGRGRSGGIYDEGLEPDRSRYSSRLEITMGGLNRALDDLDVVASHVFRLPDVDRECVLIGGVSRGGLLALVYAAMHPYAFRGALNFVGGWHGETTAGAVVNPTLFVRGASFPGATLWVYGENDSYYSVAHSENNFRRFIAAGGRGEFQDVASPAGSPGHRIHQHPALWEGAIDGYLSGASLPMLGSAS